MSQMKGWTRTRKRDVVAPSHIGTCGGDPQRALPGYRNIGRAAGSRLTRHIRRWTTTKGRSSRSRNVAAKPLFPTCGLLRLSSLRIASDTAEEMP